MPKNWRELLANGQPFVVNGAARCRLDLDRVAKLGSVTEIVVKNQRNGDVGRATLRELVSCLGQADAVWYMAQHAVPECLAPHVPKRPVPGLPGLRKPNLWLGSTHAFTQLHQDVLHNVILQLDGRKRFVLFAPEDERFLYREPSEVRANYSRIALTSAVDAATYPDFSNATPFVVELRPKDMLVLPAYWWHEVTTLESSLMLNYWWAPTLDAVAGIDPAQQIFSATVARRHVMRHLDLTGLDSDHALIDALVAHRLPLFAALILADMAEEVVDAFGSRHELDARLYPATREALLKTRGVIANDVTALMKQIREEAVAAEAALRTKTATNALDTVELNERLRALCATQRFPPCNKTVLNNRVWMKSVYADSYLF